MVLKNKNYYSYMNDLDINNYSMEDILKLFKIHDFDEEEMKRAKKMVLKSHPDKSRLPSEYFFFYSKAYKILYSMYEFKNKTRKDQNTEYSPNISEAAVAIHLKKIPTEKFASWFNEEFEKRREETEGYEDWLKSNEGIIHGNVKLSEMNQFFESNAVVVKEEIKEFVGGNYTSLGKQSFQSEPFASLHYSDLKEAHTLAPVSMNEYHTRPKYSVNEYKTHRQTEDVKNVPYDEKKSMAILSEKLKMEETESISRAYYYAKKTQEASNANKVLLSKLKLIK